MNPLSHPAGSSAAARPRTVKVTVQPPAADQPIRIPPDSLRPVPLSAAPPEAPAEEIGKPQLRAPELKIEAPAPPPAPAAPVRPPRSRQSVWALRGTLLLGMSLALGLLYWSVFVRLLPVTAEHRDRALAMTRAADELEALRSRWSPGEVAEVRARYERARQSLFDPASDLAEWQAEVREQARMRVFEVVLSLGQAQPAPGPSEGLRTIAAQVDLQPSPVFGSATSPYGRLLKLTEALGGSPKRLDLIELSVTGDSNSVTRARAVVQIYSAERGAL